MMFRQKTKAQQEFFIISVVALSVVVVLGVIIMMLLTTKIRNTKMTLTNLEELQTHINTQHNKLLMREGFINNADATYNTMVIRKEKSIESYIAELKTIIAASMSYYDNVRPITVTISYSNVPIKETSVVPVRVTLNMNNAFDYAPVRLIFVLFNNLPGSVLCQEVYIAKAFHENIYEKFNTEKYLFSSRVVLDWFILLKTAQPSYAKVFTVEYKPANKQNIEANYNMSTWNDSFMLYSHDLENLKVLHDENLKQQKY